jgi:hypothetical protein
MNEAAQNGNFFENSMGKVKTLYRWFLWPVNQAAVVQGRKGNAKVLSGFVLGERFNLQIFSGEKGQSRLTFFLTSGPTQNDGHLFSDGRKATKVIHEKIKGYCTLLLFCNLASCW